MSQEKIDKRKAEKANRKKMLAKKKQKRIVNTIIAILVTVCFVVLICLAVGQLSGKFEKETTAQSVSYSAEELSSLSEALGISTETTAATETDANGETVSTTETSAEEGTSEETSSEDSSSDDSSSDDNSEEDAE